MAYDSLASRVSQCEVAVTIRGWERLDICSELILDEPHRTGLEAR